MAEKLPDREKEETELEFYGVKLEQLKNECKYHIRLIRLGHNISFFTILFSLFCNIRNQLK